MKQKKILFLGGAFSQVPAIQYAKDQGYFVITADYLPENPGHKISDEYYNVSTTLKEEILILSEKLEIDAISAYASDPAAPTAAYVSEKMNLVGSSFRSVEILSRKNLFRAFLKKNGFKSPWFINGSDLKELKNNYSGKPAILKPVDSSGSKGIFLIQNYQDLEAHFHESKKFSRSGEVILEELIERKGPQIHGDGFVINGKPVFLLLGDQIFSGSDNMVPYSTIVPSRYHTDVMKKVHTLVESALSKVGFGTGGINVEVIRDKNDDLYILEIGARNGGNFMPQLMKYASGFDLVKINVDALFQKAIEIKTNNYFTSYYAQVILHSKKAGIFQDIDIPIEFKDKVLEKTIYYKACDKINAYKSSKDVVGVMIIEVDKQSNHFDLMQKFLTLNKWVKIENLKKINSCHYQLNCPTCGWHPEIDSYDIFCPVCGPEVLLKTCYSPHLCFDETISPSSFYHYSPVLPFSKRFSETGPSMGCWHAKDLGELLGLNNLWVLFSGYAPNLEATFYSGTFKELEALGVFARVLEQTNKTLIVSSAGNAGRSFLQIGLKYQLPVIVVVPENALPELFAEPGHDPSNILLIALKNAYYPAAIQMVKHIKEKFSDFLVSESGCFNVARRDALGVPFWRAVNAIGHLPRHYVQAVGSGTGAIAAWEARSRLIASQIVPVSPLCLHLVQNIPFIPMVDAWSTGNKKVKPMNDDEIGTRLSQTVAKVLSNANPPYSVKGGVYDVLQESCGHMYAVTNDEIHQNMSVIEEVLGVKPAPESAAALAGLKQALKIGNIESEDCVLLHLTGGGMEASIADNQSELVRPNLIIDPLNYQYVDNFIAKYLTHLTQN